MKRKPGRPRSKDPRVTLSVRVKKETKRGLRVLAAERAQSAGAVIDWLVADQGTGGEP